MTRCPARLLLPMSSLALIAGTSISAWAGGAACSGPLSQEHSLAPFDFYTNSLIQPNQDENTKGIYPFVTTSCAVSGHVNANVPTRVKWFIPKIDGWLNSDVSQIPVNIFNIDQPRQMDGCLEYGNQSLDIKATFFGDSKEQQKVDHENEIGCRQTAAEAPSSGQGSLGVVEKLIRIVQSVTNYLPSSSKYPGQTMLHLQGEAGIAVKDNETYLSYLRYTLTPYNNTDSKDVSRDVKPTPTAVTVSPNFLGPGETLAKAYSTSGNPSSI